MKGESKDESKDESEEESEEERSEGMNYGAGATSAWAAAKNLAGTYRALRTMKWVQMAGAPMGAPMMHIVQLGFI